MVRDEGSTSSLGLIGRSAGEIPTLAAAMLLVRQESARRLLLEWRIVSVSGVLYYR